SEGARRGRRRRAERRRRRLMPLLRTKEIRAMDADTLGKKLSELRDELMHERGVAAMGGAPPNPGKIRALRKNIARILTILAEKKARPKAATAAVPSAPGARDIGIDVPSPAKVCTDRKCPFHGGLPVRGQMLEGVVVSTRMQNTVVIEREYLRYIQKFERF